MGKSIDMYKVILRAQQKDEEAPRKKALSLIVKPGVKNGVLPYPDPHYSDEYEKLVSEYESSKTDFSQEELQKHVRKRLGVIFKNTAGAPISPSSEVQELMDDAVKMPLSQLLKERKKYGDAYEKLVEQYNAISPDPYVDRAEEVIKKWRKKFRSSSLNIVVQETFEQQCSDEVEKILDEFKREYNKILFKAWEVAQYEEVYRSTLKRYVSENADLISEEINEAKKREIRDSLSGLVDFIDEEQSNSIVIGGSSNG